MRTKKRRRLHKTTQKYVANLSLIHMDNAEDMRNIYKSRYYELRQALVITRKRKLSKLLDLLYVAMDRDINNLLNVLDHARLAHIASLAYFVHPRKKNKCKSTVVARKGRKITI